MPNGLPQCDLILGTDIINKVNLYVQEGRISVRKPRVEIQAANDLPEIFKIELVSDRNDIDLSHLTSERKNNVNEIINKLNKLAVNFGNPRRIISDRGTAFTSNEFREYCKKENIEHVLITTGVPRANGQVERMNRT